MTIQNNLTPEQVALAVGWFGVFICIVWLAIKEIYNRGFRKGWAKGYARGKQIQSERHIG